MLSLAMIAKNEEQYLDRCLKSVSTLVDEMIVVDTGSTDRTREIARDNGAVVYDFEWCDDFSAARNFSIEKTSGDWVVVLDADEYFAEDYADVIREFISRGQQIGRFEFIARFVKDGLTQSSQYSSSRLFPRHIRYMGRIHEQLVSDLPRCDTGALVMHDGYYMTEKSERNIKLLLQEVKQHPGDPYLLFQLGKQYRGNNEYEAAGNYLLEAYQNLSGPTPYALEVILELLEVLTHTKKYVTAFDLVEGHAELFDTSPDFCFATALFLLDYAIDTNDHSVIGDIEQCYLTCLEMGKHQAKEVVIGTSTFMAAYNLAVFYETTGLQEKATEYYVLSSSYGFEPAKKKLEGL